MFNIKREEDENLWVKIKLKYFLLLWMNLKMIRRMGKQRFKVTLNCLNNSKNFWMLHFTVFSLWLFFLIDFRNFPEIFFEFVNLKHSFRPFHKKRSLKARRFFFSSTICNIHYNNPHSNNFVGLSIYRNL